MKALSLLGLMATVCLSLVACENEPLPSAVRGIEITPAITLLPGTTRTPEMVVLPATAKNKNVTWSSDNTNIAVVDTESGTILAVGEGKTVVTATTEEGGHTATCVVTVSRNILDLIPDPGFRAYCEKAMSQWDTDRDGILSSDEAAQVTLISVDYNDIYSLSGIEYFTALEYLDCRYNQLTYLDLSNNTALVTLDCGYNRLTSLDLSHNTALEYLDCSYNQPTTLDLSGNTALENLNCSDNQLKSLDLSKNTALVTLDCDYNQLSSLNLSGCTSLRELHCLYNELPSLDISNNTDLTYLTCYGNPGDGISKFPVKAWFDNTNLPYNLYLYDTYWYYGNVQITIDFQKVV